MCNNINIFFLFKHVPFFLSKRIHTCKKKLAKSYFIDRELQHLQN
jgi:hypothetical protein